MLREFVCGSCAAMEERWVSASEIGSQRCACGGVMVKVMGAVRLIGPTDTRPVKINGKTLTSQGQISRWENDNPGKAVLTRSDSVVRDVVHEGRQFVEQRAQSYGYRSEKHRQAEVKKEARLKGENV